MRNMFDFYGLHAPERKKVYEDLIRADKKAKAIDWVFLDRCYEDGHREFQYLVCNYLLAAKQYVVFEDIPKIRKYIITKSWWDTIDFLDKVKGFIDRHKDRMSSLSIREASKYI